MIEKTVIEGKPCFVQYLDDAGVPADKQKYTMAYIKFENGDTMYAQTAATEPSTLRKFAQSIAHGFAHLFKANPYHDKSGRFANKNSPGDHHFVSIGGKFTRSNTRDRKEFGREQTQIAADLKPLFNKHKEQRMSNIQDVVDAKFDGAIPPAPARRTRAPRAPRAPSPAQLARAAALAQREAIAARRAELIAERTAVVAANVNHRAYNTRPLSAGERARLQATADNVNAAAYSRENARERLAGADHGDLLRQHGLTLNSTFATAGRVPAHHLRPDAFGRSLAELNTAHGTARAATAAARQAALGASLYNMSSDERRQYGSRLSTQARRNAQRALVAHAENEATRLTSLPHPERQAQLDAMTDSQRSTITNNQSWDQRRHWERQATDHNTAVAETARLDREGPHTGRQLHEMSDEARAKAFGRLNETQQAGAAAARKAHEQAIANNLSVSSHASREATLTAMSQSQRHAVTSRFTPEQLAGHETQRVAHFQQEKARRVLQEQQAAARAVAEARARATAAERAAMDQQTVDNMTPAQKQAHASVKALRARGVEIRGGDRDLHPDPDIAFALDFTKKYKGVDPKRLIEGYVGKGTPLKHGTSLQMGTDTLDISMPRGAMLHGSELDYNSSRSIRKGQGGKLEAENNLLQLKTSSRGGGSGKKHFAEMIPTYMDMGVTKLKVHGALENGFHTWAKYGFSDNTPPAWRKQAMQMVDRAVSQMPNMSAEARGELAKLHKAVRRFGDSAKFPNLAVRMKLPALTKAYKDAGLSRRSSGNDFLGEALMNGNWYGTIKFDDKRQMARVKKYVKGKDIKYFDKDGKQQPLPD